MRDTDSYIDHSLKPVDGPELAPSASTANPGGGRERNATEPMTGASIVDGGEQKGELTRGGSPVTRCLTLHNPIPVALAPGLMPAYVSNTFGAAAASPTFLFPALCACSAAAGRVKLSNLSGTLGSLSLRTVFVTPDRRLPRDMMPVLEAVYDFQTQSVNAWARLCQGQEDDRRERREDAVRPELPPRTRFVVDDGRSTTLTKALRAGRQGLLVISEGKMPSFSRIGTNYDGDTADLLNKSSAGTKIAIEETPGCVKMRHVTISAIGAMTPADALALFNAPPGALVATFFVPTGEGDVPVRDTAFEGLSIVLARLRAMSGRAGALRLSLSPQARNSLDGARKEFEGSSAIQMPPLSYFCRHLVDLAERLAAQLHLIRQVVEAPSQSPNSIIQAAEMDCAVNLIRHYVAPAAFSVLAQASVEPAIRQARRILSYFQQHASRRNPGVRLGDLLKSFKRIPRGEIDDALAILTEDGLLAYCKGAPTAHPIVFGQAYQLPDFVGCDPRRT
jgi:hypothetical protein